MARGFITGLTIHCSHTACKVLDELLELRLFREEKEAWIEKGVITRIWICCTTRIADETLETLGQLFDNVTQNMEASFSARATHAAQTVRIGSLD